MNKRVTSAVFVAAIWLGGNSVAAGETDNKLPETVRDEGISIELGSTIVGQQITKRNGDINKPLTASVDLVIDAELGFGTLHLYGEGATKADVSAASLVAGSNLDAGTAATPSGKGRIQLSEISFGSAYGAWTYDIGIMDLTAFADATATANDEGYQFLADALVNNLTIPFPDYTPGLVLNHGDEELMQFTAMVANAYGLGDNPQGNYAQLLNFGRTPAGERKGLFSLAEIRLPITDGSMLLTFGGWHSSMEAARINGLGSERSRVGAYLNLDGTIGEVAWSARAGLNGATSDVTGGINRFVSLSAEHAFNEQLAIGAGVAWSGLRGDYKASLAPVSAANSMVTELYCRWQVSDEIAISPDLQFHQNANHLSTAAAGSVSGNVWVYGLRIQFGMDHQMARRAN